jgi:transcriptional regulator with XRE-family HTH domain
MAFNPPKKAKQPYLQPMMLAIQGAMRERGLNTKSLAEAMGITVPPVYNWVAGKNGPSPAMRVKLAKVLGLTEAVLTSPLPSGSHGRPAAAVQLGPAQRAVVLAEQARPTAATSVLLSPAEPVRDVFSITGRSDGQINVRLQVTLDAQRGMALARFLMDFGLIIGEENPDG